MREIKNLDLELRSLWGEESLTPGLGIESALERLGEVSVPPGLKSKLLAQSHGIDQTNRERQFFRWGWITAPALCLALVLTLLPEKPELGQSTSQSASVEDYKAIALLAAEFIGEPFSTEFEASDRFEDLIETL